MSCAAEAQQLRTDLGEEGHMASFCMYIHQGMVETAKTCQLRGSALEVASMYVHCQLMGLSWRGADGL
jgi:hypothetical protein